MKRLIGIPELNPMFPRDCVVLSGMRDAENNRSWIRKNSVRSEFLRIQLRIAVCFFLPLTLAIVNWTNLAQSQQGDDEATQAANAKRFLQIVERNPQRGTALEKVFSYHLQMGTLDQFIGELRERTQSEPDDGVAWMLLGLFESQRRMDPPAILAFWEAEKLRPNDALPAFYRGQCSLRMGELTQAATAFEIAIQRKPTRIILLEAFEHLGRTYQRQNRNDLAIDAWTRLESLFPNDLHVLEQIASIQNQEGDHKNALPRYERLIALAKEPTQRIQYRIEVAQIRIQLGSDAQGLSELENILAELKPDGWLYRDVQRKIEDVFLKKNDQPGLVRHYETRLASFPDDIESIVRLCKFLVASGRLADANRWIVQAIERAPSRTDLRKVFIEQLLAEKQFSSACEQFSQLSQLDPKNADILRDWGKTVLLVPNRSIQEARKEASQIWNKMIDPSSEQAIVLIQVAELLLSTRMPAEAQKLFERAIELEPEETQYREFYGQFLFDQNQPEKAYQVWQSIIEGTRRTPETLMRLAEIYDHVKQTEKAVLLACEACQLATHDGTLFVKTARLQKKAGQMDGALVSLASADRLAESDEQRELILHDRLDILESTNSLKSETEKLKLQIQLTEKPTSAQWQLLARYLVRQRRWQEAHAATSQFLLLDPSNLVGLLLSAEISEGLGNAKASIKSLRKLVDLDRRKRIEYLERIAGQQVHQKNLDDAIQTAQEIVQAAPSKVESYEFLSQICFQAKQQELGIDALRKALRIDPNSSRLTLALANALSSNQQSREAIEMYWQTFSAASSLDEKIDLCKRMVKVYQVGLYRKENLMPSLLDNAVPLSELIQRMETARRDPTQRRDLSICLLQAYYSIPDYPNARRVMQELFDAPEDGQRAKAIEIISREFESSYQKAMARTSAMGINPSRTESTKVSSFAYKLLELGLPVESYRHFEKRSDEHIRFVAPELQDKARESGQQAAIALLDSFPADKAIFEILQDRSSPDRNVDALELMLQLPIASANQSSLFESAMQTTLVRHAKSGKESEIEKGLQKLVDLRPSDLSIQTTQARVRLATGAAETENSLREIERIGSEFDTVIDQLLSAAGEATTEFSVPPFAESIVSTWLVARHCIETSQNLEIADRIANRALRAAKLIDLVNVSPNAANQSTKVSGTRVLPQAFAASQGKLDTANRILLEWGKVLVQQGKTEAGIAKWNELIAKLEGKPKKVAQWTKPQFEQLMQLAHVAIEVGLVEISHDVARKVAERAMPTPDAPESMRNRPSGFSYQMNREFALKPSIKALTELMQRWGDENSPPSVCCDLLLPIVFPNDEGVYLFSDQSRLLHLLHVAPTNLAAKLVDYAAKANRLSEIKELLERRNHGINSMILMTQVAIAEKDFEKAKALLARLHENYQTGRATDVLAINCQVAIPAFHVEELRDAALPILQELMMREKEVGKHPEASFKLFPLVREVDEYFLARIKRQREEERQK